VKGKPLVQGDQSVGSRV